VDQVADLAIARARTANGRLALPFDFRGRHAPLRTTRSRKTQAEEHGPR
jgi:hypothetical protein